MSDIYNPKTIRIPVKLVDGNWEYFYGASLPVKNGAVADLLVDESAVIDKDFLKVLKRKSKHKIIEEGVKLLVALTIKDKPELDPELKKHLKKRSSSGIKLGSSFYYKLRSDDTQFVEISIGALTDKQKQDNPKEDGGIWLELQGMQPKSITTSSIKLPDGVFDDEIISLNHAFTLLSEKYEPWRKSHTGNIYDRFLYQETNGTWYPIEVLRNTEIIKEEHQLIKEQWKRIASELNLTDLFHSGAG